MINEIVKLEVEIMKYEEFLEAFSEENENLIKEIKDRYVNNIITKSQL